MSNLGHLNLQRAHLLINTLLEQGVGYFCLAPGSRSTALMLAVTTICPEKVCVHFDERGLGFYALGLCKAIKAPVAIIVTSGTAVANLLPAVVEASLTRMPLIILSADRPIELREIGANQTIDQVHIFGSFTNWVIDLPLSDPLCPDDYFCSCASFAVQRSKKGPVQINCMIREPFFSSLPYIHNSIVSCRYEAVESIPSNLEEIAFLLSSSSKGIILLASEAISCHKDLLTLAEKLGFPIISDIISGGRKIGSHPFHIEYFDLYLKINPDLQVDTVLQIGDRIVSKTLFTWLKNQKKARHLLIAPHEERQDPTSSVSLRIECRGETFCKYVTPLISSTTNNTWLTHCQRISTLLKKTLFSFFKENQTFSEPAIIYSLDSFSHLFFSNSMPIRDADLFLFPSKGIENVFANRGASGIDGNIATALGIAKGLKKPLVAVLGDLAALHDINSLALVKKSPVPVIFLIINNQGGGIFSFLPISERKEIFEEFVATSHSYSFACVADTFSIPFFCAHTLTEWQKLILELKERPQSCLIECYTNREQNVFNHETIYRYLKDHLCSFIEPLEIQEPPS